MTEEHLDATGRAELEVVMLRRGGRAFAPLVATDATWAKDDKVRSSVYATIQNLLLRYADPTVEEALAGCDVDFDECLSAPNTIYVVAPPHEPEHLRPVLIVLLQSAIRRAYREPQRRLPPLAVPGPPRRSGQHGTPPRPPCLAPARPGATASAS